MRVGSNPLRSDRVNGLPAVMLGVVTHLPNEIGYHAKRFDVIRACLSSMKERADYPHGFIVWDNGSIPKLKEWIRREIKPDIFIESRNVGKSIARACVVNMLPEKTILAFSDDDILYLPNWLKPQIELLQHFPNVSSVSGYPIRTSFRWGCENTIRWAKQNGELEAGRFLPDEWERDFAVSIGRDVKVHFDGTQKDVDYRVTYKGKRAFCVSHHCQFVGYAGRISQAVKYDAAAMADEKPFDNALDALGLRLSTTQRLARHIGNVLDEEIKKHVTVYR